MTTPPRDPLAGTTRLLIDGNNLLGLLARRGTTTPATALVGRLRALAPATVAIELVFDGPPDRGLRGAKVAPGISVRHSGGRSADAVLIDLVDQERARSGPAGAADLLVVTDDAALRRSLRMGGARVAGGAWLLGRLERPAGGGRARASSAVGNARPPRPAGGGRDETERTPWAPGRGATVKRGNPRRGPSSSGRMRP